MRDYDVIVTGAGPAGAVAAALLARSGRKTALIDRLESAMTGKHKIGESLPEAGALLLRRLGLCAPGDGGPHDRISGVRSIWGAEESFRDSFNDPGGGGWRLDRRRFDGDLRSDASGAGAVLLREFVVGISRNQERWQLRTASGNILSAETIIDASGRSAALARRIGAKQTAEAPLVAVWAVGEPGPAGYSTHTFIETVPSGFWYGAFLPGGAPLAAFHCEPALAAELATTPSRWRAALENTRLIASALPTILGRASPRRSDARGLVLEPACGHGWFACGDAALSFNPLASQGIFNAIATGAAAAKAILARRSQGALDRYQDHILESHRRYEGQLREWQGRSGVPVSDQDGGDAGAPNRVTFTKALPPWVAPGTGRRAG